MTLILVILLVGSLISLVCYMSYLTMMANYTLTELEKDKPSKSLKFVTFMVPAVSLALMSLIYFASDCYFFG